MLLRKPHDPLLLLQPIGTWRQPGFVTPAAALSHAAAESLELQWIEIFPAGGGGDLRRRIELPNAVRKTDDSLDQITIIQRARARRS